jgi:hypothetical protein
MGKPNSGQELFFYGSAKINGGASSCVPTGNLTFFKNGTGSYNLTPIDLIPQERTYVVCTNNVPEPAAIGWQWINPSLPTLPFIQISTFLADTDAPVDSSVDVLIYTLGQSFISANP